jgi:hypothetical protein
MMTAIDSPAAAAAVFASAALTAVFIGYVVLGFTKRTCAVCGRKVREFDAMAYPDVPGGVMTHLGLCSQQYEQGRLGKGGEPPTVD